MKITQTQNLRRIFFVIFTLSSNMCLAQSASPLDELSAGNYQALQRRFSVIQTKFEQGKLPEFDLYNAYKLFYQRKDRFRKQLNSWIAHYPKSACAYLARGVYLHELGYLRRGTQFISQVPGQNIKYMQNMDELAVKDFKKSLLLNPKSYLAVLHLLNFATSEGDDRAAENYLRMGNKILPSNIMVRVRYLVHLAPRWGGSYRKMKQFIQNSRQHGASTDIVNLMLAIVYDDKGNIAEVNKDYKVAIPYFINALVLTRKIDERIREHYLSNSLRVCKLNIHRKKEICP